MSDTPRTDMDDRQYPLPEHAQRIQFEGCECVVMSSEDYESLYEHARQLERELAAVNRKIQRMENAAEIILESCPTTWQEDVWNRAKEESAS